MSETTIKPTRSAQLRRMTITEDARAIKALRLLRGLSRAEAGLLCRVTAKAFEQVENGRCLMSPKRIEKYVIAMGASIEEFRSVRLQAQSILREIANSQLEVPKPTPKSRRNCHRIITKEVRVVRILRKRRGVTQYEAAALCGYANSIFGQIENGRIEMPEDRIKHVVRCLGYGMDAFDRLFNAEVLRDELVEQCRERLESLDDHALTSAKTVIQALMGARQ